MKVNTSKPKVTVGIRVYGEVEAELKRLAREAGLKPSPYIERVLVEHVRQQKQKGTAAPAA